MSERQIPHLRDIFGVPFDGIESSPRSRRRRRRHDDFHQLASHFDSMHVSGDSSGGTTDPDSAVSVGSSGEDEAMQQQQEKPVKSRKSSSKRDNEFGHRTLSQKDVRHLERHLSMKKTIRKKIMRDLQQAFVEDPSEFRVDPEQQGRREVNLIGNLNFNGPSQQSDANFLEILRDDDRDSGHSSPTRQSRRDSRQQHLDAARTDDNKRQTSFWKRFAFMGKSKR
ncbi:Hypothetical predicted protein [Cloeon dipterum]|uniref:Uncharacterized protein n=1 Tax=Cloeon dipterum TaxID=197152 RepID=A0A8S1DPP8_9INSE|nr:Hypothetical predicted protein [Cloeon dipterum]CAB3384401.1 Hypothetical predicted protein [Cloeon dipterum]